KLQVHPPVQIPRHSTSSTPEFPLDSNNANHTPTSLVDRHPPASARSFHQKHQRSHHQNSYSKQPEVVNVCQHAGLAEEVCLEQSVSLVHGISRRKSSGLQHARHALQRALGIWIPR